MLNVGVYTVDAFKYITPPIVPASKQHSKAKKQRIENRNNKIRLLARRTISDDAIYRGKGYPQIRDYQNYLQGKGLLSHTPTRHL